MDRPTYLQRPPGVSAPSAFSYWKEKGCPSCVRVRVIAPHRFNAIGPGKPCVPKAEEEPTQILAGNK